ncbi:MAG: aminopeptidase [Spirochaetes bacterium]|nr:aminopeptidase [Spirochaetota bacterium]MBU1080765.1 aminopeptidase [Spirochaetota bacterium]
MNPSIPRAVVALAAAAAIVVCLSSCWYSKQAAFFLSERAGAVPVSKVAADSSTPERVALFLSNVESIRSFAVDRAGLSSTKNYTRYVTTDKGYVADVVSACAADSFDRHYWRYPVVGALPYKGFYEKADADAEAARLKEAGLDVIVRKVDAFSSLGFFKDPLYSFMADYEEDELAELVLHESAHATLFVKGADQFNEEFATFVGRVATDVYIEERYGPDSDVKTRRASRRADGQAFVAFLKETARRLGERYGDESMSKGDRLAEKAAIIAARAEEYRIEAPTLFAGDGYRNFDMGSINNAYIDLYRLYEEDLGLYQRYFEVVASGSIREFVSSVSALAATARKDVKRQMEIRLDHDTRRSE